MVRVGGGIWPAGGKNEIRSCGKKMKRGKKKGGKNPTKLLVRLCYSFILYPLIDPDPWTQMKPDPTDPRPGSTSLQ